MRIGVRGCGGRGGEALGHEDQHGANLFACDVKLLHPFLDAQIRKVFNHRRHWQPCLPKHPCTTDDVGMAFNRVTLRPIKHCHRLLPSFLVVLYRSRLLCVTLGFLSNIGRPKNPRNSRQIAGQFPTCAHAVPQVYTLCKNLHPCLTYLCYDRVQSAMPRWAATRQQAWKTVTAWVALNISESRPRRGPVRLEPETQAGTR